MSARSRAPRERNGSARDRLAAGAGERLRHPGRHVGGAQLLERGRAEGGLDHGDRLRCHVALAEIPECGDRGARRLARELQPAAVRGVDHPDGDAADADRAAGGAGVEHGRGRHLGAEPEPPCGFGAVDLDRLAIAARDGLDHPRGCPGGRCRRTGWSSGGRRRRERVAGFSRRATRRESARSTAPRVPSLSKRAAVKGLPRGSLPIAVRTAFAVDMARVPYV